MLPRFTGRNKKRYDRLIAQGVCETEATNMLYAEEERASFRATIKRLEGDNRALRATIKQLCLYGTK